MPQDSSGENTFQDALFEPIDEDSMDDLDDPTSLGSDHPEVTFEDSLEAIQADALAPQDLLGFSDISRKQIHQLRSVWSTLPEEHRSTLSDLVLMIAREQPYADFGRFFQVLLEDSSESVRLNASTGAGLSEITTLISTLVNLAEHDPSVDVREAAILALATHVVGLDLGVIADTQDEKKLRRLKAWAKDESWSSALRAAALQAYSYDTSDDETGSIIEDFVSSDDETLQLGAMRAMTQYGADQFTRFLELELRDPDVDRREAAAFAMGQSTDESVVPMLTMAAREDEEPIVREAAYTALGNLGNKASLKSLQTLREYASDDEIEVIDASIQYAMELQELDGLEELGMFEFEDESEF